MLIPHLHFNGDCFKAIELYKEAFNAEVNVIIPIDKENPEKGVLHAEVHIHGQRVMLNDNRSQECSIDFPFVQLIVTFESEEELKRAYVILKDEQRIVSPMKATDFTPCTVGFWDKYGVRWGFMI